MASGSRSFDVAVIGLGAMGSAALYQLARRGVRVVGIDRFAPPHIHGSTHGETRITRQGVGEGEAYVPLVMRSHAIWRELEAATGETLLTECGCLVVGPAEGAGPDAAARRRADFLATTRRAAETFGIAHEMLSADEVRHRFPQFSPQDEEAAYFEPTGGYVDPERCVAVQLQRARELGATVMLNSPVLAIDATPDSVRVTMRDGDILAGEVVMAAGSWTGGLLGPPFDGLLSTYRQVMHWFPIADERLADWQNGPVFLWMYGATSSDMLYGFPALPGHRTMKTAEEQYDIVTPADLIDRLIDPDESRRMHAACVAGRLQGLAATAERSITCLYTVTPDSHFLIDRHPAHERVIVASPCSGHGFKHSAGIGDAVATLVTGSGAAIDLSPFSVARRLEALAD